MFVSVINTDEAKHGPPFSPSYGPTPYEDGKTKKFVLLVNSFI